MKERPDLVIADVMMPKLSGFEMVESLRAAPETKDTKVIMMTALGQAEDQARGEKLGVVKYLVKSQVTLEDFARVVQEALGPGDSNAVATTQKDEVSNNNQPESENHMPEDSTTNPVPAPADPAAPAGDPGVNPVSGDAPADNSVSTDQQSTAQESGVVQDQINNFAAPSAAPAGDTPAVDQAPAPEAPAPSADPAAPAGDTPAAPPADPTSNAL